MKKAFITLVALAAVAFMATPASAQGLTFDGSVYVGLNIGLYKVPQADGTYTPTGGAAGTALPADAESTEVTGDWQVDINAKYTSEMVKARARVRGRDNYDNPGQNLVKGTAQIVIMPIEGLDIRLDSGFGGNYKDVSNTGTFSGSGTGGNANGYLGGGHGPDSGGISHGNFEKAVDVTYSVAGASLGAAYLFSDPLGTGASGGMGYGAHLRYAGFGATAAFYYLGTMSKTVVAADSKSNSGMELGFSANYGIAGASLGFALTYGNTKTHTSATADTTVGQKWMNIRAGASYDTGGFGKIAFRYSMFTNTPQTDGADTPNAIKGDAMQLGVSYQYSIADANTTVGLGYIMTQSNETSKKFGHHGTIGGFPSVVLTGEAKATSNNIIIGAVTSF